MDEQRTQPLHPLLAAFLLGSSVMLWSVPVVHAFTGRCSVKGTLGFVTLALMHFISSSVIKALLVVYCCIHVYMTPQFTGFDGQAIKQQKPILHKFYGSANGGEVCLAGY